MQKQIVRNESMRTVIRYAFWLLSLFLMSEIQAVTPQKAPLKLGAERMDVVTRLLKDKQVGLVVNQTSILEKQQKHLLDALLEEGINIKKVFAPEHGFRGTADAGAEIKDSRDVKTGVPIISLYGKNKKADSRAVGRLGRGRVRHSGCRSPLLYLHQHHALCDGSLCRKRCRIYRPGPP